MEEKKIYYEVILDSYNQPSGDIMAVVLTGVEYEQMRISHFLFETYQEAVMAAMD